MRLLDAHVHLHHFSVQELERLRAERPIQRLLAVSDDEASSRKTLRLAESLEGVEVVPCVGLHPWSVKGRASIEEARRVVELVLDSGARCLGEIGLDTKFVPESIEAQREVLKVFLEASRDHGFFLNLHTAGTWEEVLRLLQRYDIAAANFHWFTGPPALLRSIEELGYTISINPALKVQKKHQDIVMQAPLSIILTESDGPYNYKGIRLGPWLVPETVKLIASIKGLSLEEVVEAVWKNFEERVAPRLRR